MTGVSCLVRNTALVKDLKDLVEYIGYQRVSEGRSASVSEVYNIIRQAGIEIDLQSIGHIYNDTLPKSYQNFQSDQEVNYFVLKNYNDAINRAAMLEDKTGEEKTGEDSPEIYVVNGLLNMFTNANVADETTQSDMLKMQNALWKGIQRKLNLPEKEEQPSTRKEWKEVINQVLGYEQLGLVDINGKLNSISDLYNAMRDQLRDAGKELLRRGDYAEVERWYDMVDALEGSTYNLLFSKGEAKNVLYDMMKEAGFAKELQNGQKIINWNKLAGNIGSVQDLRNNVQSVLEKNGFNQDVIDRIKDSLENEFNDLHAEILSKAEQSLKNKENSLGKKVEKTSDLKRLAELNNLGIFENAHDKLLNSIIGVSDLQAEDLQDLKQLANAASNLYREIDNKYGSEIYASRHLQSIQVNIDRIIARNQGNKTRMLKIVGGIKKFFDVLLTGLLSRPFTLLENLWSGAKEIVVPMVWGQKGMNKEERAIFWQTLKDVADRGIPFGEEIGNFAPRENYVNSIKWKWKDGTVGERVNSLVHIITFPGRIGLLGFDSANKVTITNKVFKNAIYQALTQDNKMSKEDALNFMNEALYGKSFEDAKSQAKEMIEKINKDLPQKYQVPVNNKTIVTFANDLVKANLNANGALTNEVIEAAYKASYHVAGYGLGHEPNNYISSQVKGGRDRRRKEEQRLAKEKKWDKLAAHRLKDTMLNGMIVRFTGGAMNWLRLRFEANLGIGLVTGFAGDWNKGIDFSDKKTIQQSIKDMQNRRNQIGRSVVGLSSTLMFYAIGFGLYKGLGYGDDDDEKKLAELRERQEKGLNKYQEQTLNPTQKANIKKKIADDIKELQKETSIFKGIKGNYMLNRLFKKMSPDVMLYHYYKDTDENSRMAALSYIQNTTGLGSEFSVTSKIAEAGKLYYRGDYDAGDGVLANTLSERIVPGVPMWSAGKDWFKMLSWMAGKEVSSDYKKPTNISEGIWGGGLLEDLGMFNRNSKITNLPGIGGQAFEKFKDKGIENMNDLKDHDKWWEMKYNDQGTFKYIIRNASDRIKAKEAFEKYQKQN